MIDEVQKIHEVIEKRYEYWRKKEFKSHSIESEIRMSECQHLLLMIDILQEDPVSEDLEKASYRFACKCHPLKTGCSTSSPNPEVIEAFKTGAKWQEKKDLETIETAIHYAYYNGRLEMKEQMMVKAIEGTVRPDDDEIWCNLKSFNFKDGDKVKVIVIKED